jgi:hypothetical protein
MNQLLLWGEDAATGKLVSIHNAKNGIECNLRCPACGERLIARQGEINQHHFAHLSGKTCAGAIETVLHLRAKEFISKCNQIRLGNNKHFAYDYAKVEAPIDNLRVDVLLRNTIANRELVVEIFVSHLLTPRKIVQLNRLGFTVLEIDLSWVERDIDPSELAKLLFEHSDSRDLYEPLGPTITIVRKIDPWTIIAPILAVTVLVWLFFFRKKRPKRRYTYRSPQRRYSHSPRHSFFPL